MRIMNRRFPFLKVKMAGFSLRAMLAAHPKMSSLRLD